MSCGWLCPAGLFQDIIAWIGALLDRNRKIGIVVNKYLLQLKSYIVGITIIIFIPFLFFTNFESVYTSYSDLLKDFGRNPLEFWSLDEFFFYTLPNFFQTFREEGNLDFLRGEWLTILQLIFYFIVILLCIHYPRFYCRYLCPWAAFTKVISKNAIIALSRNPVRCVGRKACGKCEDVCPIQIRLLDEPFTRFTGNGECNLCGKCKEVCPHNAINLKVMQ
ncbi:MAG: 4Fe-4S binding protein [Promethearchaeota archaeon]